MLITNTSFYPDIKEVIDLFGEKAEQDSIEHFFSEENGKYLSRILIGGKAYEYLQKAEKTSDAILKKRLVKREIKLRVYEALSSFYGEKKPWGALTGIRPTKLAYAEIAAGKDFTPLFKKMHVSKGKRELVEEIINSQNGIYKKAESFTDFFVYIPFCASRCKYCSFITADFKSSEKFMDAYTEVLIEEIKSSKKLIKNLRSVYIGGGTPVAMPEKNLKKILDEIGRVGVEYTVEAGRPDCINENNLKLLLDYGVTRICVNPQTFNDKTLKLLGRNHTAKDVFDKYALCKDKFTVNMDLIAGLTGESFKDFKHSIDTAVSLRPDNITVHTLCLKKGAELKENTFFLDDNGVGKMIDYAHKKLHEAGYKPYYLYRQKYMAGNLENTGYALKGKECVYNIDVMEEISDNVACGANAVSKAVFCGGEKIERYKNPKDVKTYIGKIKEITEGKAHLFCETL